MIIKLRKKPSSKEVDDSLKRIHAKSKTIDWKKYVGKIKLPDDPVAFQRNLRDEWER
jgi:hypothetical protein